jgi:hypothetical protein
MLKGFNEYVISIESQWLIDTSDTSKILDSKYFNDILNNINHNSE